MTDRPQFRPTADGFDDAILRSRRRRQRRWAAATATIGAAAVAAVLVLPGLAPQSTTLRVVNPVASQSTTATSAPTTRPSATPTPTTRATAPQPARPGPRATAVPGATHLYEGTPVATLPPPPPVATTARISTLMQRRIRSYDNPLCTDTSGRTAAGWCVVVPADGALHGTAGMRRPLQVRLCHFAGLDNRVDFSNDLEAEMWITTKAADRSTPWRYSHQHPADGGARTYDVPVGSCLDWSTAWWVVDDSAAPLPSGSYDLHVMVNADNINGPNSVLVQTYAFIVD